MKDMKNLFILAITLASAYSLNVPLCNSSSQIILPFTYINGSSDSTTTASLCHDGQSFLVNWSSIDSEIISNYKRCNDPLYKEDVVEIFISTLDSYPNNYFELQVSPTSQLFFADITNGKGDCSALGTNYFDCGAVRYKAWRTTKGWDAELQVSLQVIGRGQVQNRFKVNLFRVDYSTGIATRYLTWQPTFANPACFHKPEYFQEIVLV